MAKTLVMPRLGNSVETVVITEWHKQIGDAIQAGEALCEVETDKTTMPVESDEEGILLACLFEVDDEVSVLSPYAIVGQEGEDVSGMIPEAQGAQAKTGNGKGGAGSTQADSLKGNSDTAAEPQGTSGNASKLAGPQGLGGSPEPASPAHSPGPVKQPVGESAAADGYGISPRARKTVVSSGLPDLKITGPGSGPGGRVIEADVQAVLKDMPRLTPAARKRLVANSSVFSSASGAASPGASSSDSAPPSSTAWETIPIKGVRKVIAERMRNSLAHSAQLTLNSTAPADSLLRLRSIFKESPPERGLAGITINNLLMFAVARTLLAHPQVNAHYLEGEREIRQFHVVHLGFAVDSPRGLMVPVIRNAHGHSLASLAQESRRLAEACREGHITADNLSGSTFTMSNLGMFGVEHFTPVINPPEAAILGVGTIREQRLSLSLTFDHQALDGAPAARFLQDLVAGLSHLEWLLAGQEA